ncbi:ABC transporter permease [Paenibacillus sp. FSL K6-1217]|uniref:FtsX-like permease family protein n=1 Tax=Paenibacillus sp. FSL K6-1217 TaxID=2921466 RepID=UPI00324A8267
MTFRQFAFRNVSRNTRLYTAYFLSSMFTVMVFFTFSIFAYHPVLSGGQIHSSAALALSVSKWVIYVFSFFFVLYSMSAFLQSRKREFGLMMMHGMTVRQLRRMIFLENMIVGSGATVSGIGLGVIFAKGILLAGENVLALNKPLQFYFPFKAMGVTLISFLLLFVLISLFISTVLRSGKLITLIQANRQPKPEPKASLLLSLLVVLLLGVSYFLSLRASGLAVVLLLAPVVIMVSVGTYLLFTQLSVYLIRKLKAREGLFWHKTNMLLFSDLSYRMKDNARSFFLVAIISTVSFSAIGALYGFQSMINGTLTQKNPYLFTYLSADGDSKAQAHVQLIDQSLAQAGIAAEPLSLKINYYKAADSSQTLALVKQSDYNRIAGLMGLTPIRLATGDGTAAIVDFGLSRKGEELLHQQVKLQSGMDIEAEQAVVSSAIRAVSGYYVVPDERIGTLGQPFKVSRYYAWHGAAGQHGVQQVGELLTSKLPYDEHATFYALEYQTSRTNDYFGPVMFIGFFVGIVFFVSAGSFLYFRLYSDLDEDKQKFKAISKLGLSDKELGRILNRQISLLFFAPIVVALVHGAVALTALSHMFQYSIFRESLLVLGLFFFIQVIYFFIVRLFYTRQIRSALTG